MFCLVATVTFIISTLHTTTIYSDSTSTATNYTARISIDIICTVNICPASIYIVVSLNYYVFATMLTGPRKNACFEIPSHGLFLCPEEKIHTVLYNVQYLTCGSFKYKKPLLGVMASSAGVRTSLRSNLQLRINCPTSHKLLVLPLPLNSTLNLTFPHM
jgi:hypothetical protein